VKRPLRRSSREETRMPTKAPKTAAEAESERQSLLAQVMELADLAHAKGDRLLADLLADSLELYGAKPPPGAQDKD